MSPRSAVAPLAAIGSTLFPEGPGDRRAWLRIFLYSLFVASTFTIAGIEASTILLYVTVLFHRWREPMRDRLPAWLVAALCAFPAVGLVSAVVNAFPHPLRDLGFNLHQLVQDDWRWFVPLALLPALAIANTRRLLWTHLAFTALWALYALVQFRWGVDWFRPAGEKLTTPFGSSGWFHAKANFTHHLTYSGILLLIVPLYAALARYTPGPRRWLWAGGAALAALALAATMARSGWAGGALALAFLALGFPRRVLVPLLVTAVPLGALGGMLATGWLKARLEGMPQPALVQRLLATSLVRDQERLYLWLSGWIGIEQRPWLGVGPNNHRFYLPAIREEISKRTGFKFEIRGTTHVHNVFLQVAFNTGLLGLAAYLAWWIAVFHWSAIWIARAGPRFPFEQAILRGCSAGLLGSLAAGFFEYNFFDAEVQAAAVMMMGLALHAGLVIRRGLQQDAV